MISALDSRVMDLNAVISGTSITTLMQNAGKAVADFVNSRFPGKRVRIFCGHGNNGGDGLAAASMIPGCRITMVDGSEMKTDASRCMKERVTSPLEDFTASEDDFDILVDAGLGTGLTGSLRERWNGYVDFCNSFDGIVISVDVPTGFGTDNQVIPDYTVCMVDEKEGMNPESCGEIIIADIGMPAEAVGCTGPGDILRYIVPQKDAHKGCSGRLLIIGGGPYLGAPALAAKAAMRIGTDMVYAATAPRVVQTMVSFATEVMVLEFEKDHLGQSDADRIIKSAERCDAVLIGPGLGLDPDTTAAVRNIVASVDKPMVIDADGITAVAGTMHLRHNILVTPHMGEYVRLGGCSRSAEDVSTLSRNLSCTVLLKGPTDIISDGCRTCLNKTGTPAMTSAGTGDVLAGTAAGLLAKGLLPYDAARLASWIVGKAGESIAERYSFGLCASDLPDQIAVELGKALQGASR